MRKKGPSQHMPNTELQPALEHTKRDFYIFLCPIGVRRIAINLLRVFVLFFFRQLYDAILMLSGNYINYRAQLSVQKAIALYVCVHHFFPLAFVNALIAKEHKEKSIEKICFE